MAAIMTDVIKAGFRIALQGELVASADRRRSATARGPHESLKCNQRILDWENKSICGHLFILIKLGKLSFL